MSTPLPEAPAAYDDRYVDPVPVAEGLLDAGLLVGTALALSVALVLVFLFAR